ncbi:CapA family protein [Glutamicibacter sp.]|uniref:CapA family protein n=1 Tax=Glutamicibacter sp. TaxID=1931995 RepID=UPI002FCA654E
MPQRALPAFLPLSSTLLAALLIGGCSAVPSDHAEPATPQPSVQASVPASPEPAPSSAIADASAAPSAPEELSLMVTGDVLLHPQLLDEAKQAAGAETGNGGDYDFSPLLAGLAPYVQDADVALCNLETPIGIPPYSGYPRFTVPDRILADLGAIGYDGCTTATNHTVDAGTAGVERTLDALEANGLFATGSYRSEKESEKPSILDMEGVKLGVVTSTYSLNGLPEEADWQVDTGVDAQQLIARGKATRKAGADIVVAAVHDGAEYSTEPTASQKRLGRALAESGVFDFIYMHHTHSVLPIEKHDGTWIVYGLGNSVAKHATPTILNREGISVKATFTQGAPGEWDVSELRWVPHQLSNEPVAWCQVFDAAGCIREDEAKASLKRSEATVNAYGAFDDGLREWTLD